MHVNKFKRIALNTLIYSTIFIISLFLFEYLANSFVNSSYIELSLTHTIEDEFQLFYAENENNEFVTEDSIYFHVKSSNSLKKIRISLPDINIKKLRIDYGSVTGATTYIKDLTIKNGNKIAKYNYNDILEADIFNIVYKDNGQYTYAESLNADPYIQFSTLNYKEVSDYSLIFSIVASIILVFVIYKFVRLRVIYNMVFDFYYSRKLIWSLSVNDFKNKYAGSYFGIIWAFVQPICTVLVFWFVFEVGFRSANITNVPYVIWLMSGMIPWFFFSEAWNGATSAFLEYNYLVKKVVFKINILPIVKIISALFVHLFFVMFMFLVFFAYKIYPTIYCIQLIYFLICMVMLIIGLSFITASLIIFFKDLGQVMNIILQFGMWLTPIMWTIDTIPKEYRWLLKINPMYYIVQGYRDSLINHVWFYQNIKQTLYFWFVVAIFILCGALLYKKLKPHFADVL